VTDLERLLRQTHAVRGMDITFPANEVTAIIGPVPCCGKSTMVRCINRMHEGDPGRPAPRAR